MLIFRFIGKNKLVLINLFPNVRFTLFSLCFLPLNSPHGSCFSLQGHRQRFPVRRVLPGVPLSQRFPDEPGGQMLRVVTSSPCRHRDDLHLHQAFIRTRQEGNVSLQLGHLCNSSSSEPNSSMGHMTYINLYFFYVQIYFQVIYFCIPADCHIHYAQDS